MTSDSFRGGRSQILIFSAVVSSFSVDCQPDMKHSFAVYCFGLNDRGYVPVALENCAGVSRSSHRFGFHSVVLCPLPWLGGISWLSQSGVQSLAVFKPDAMLATAVAGLITCTAWWRPTLCLFAGSALSDVEFSLHLWHIWLLQFARVIQLVSSTLC